MTTGVSFIVPVCNGAPWIRETLAAILAQADGRPFEVIVVDDRSRDGSPQLLGDIAAREPAIRILSGSGRGAAAAINTGIRAARHPIICQVDQDVVVARGWMRELIARLDDPGVAAVQGCYVAAPGSSLFARVMNLDLEQRYASIRGDETTHVCTGNSAYRAAALHQVGLFDETFGYGYDNDVSYRLLNAGYTLRICRTAHSVHRWREGLAGYMAQQYGFGYGRLDLVAKHPDRATGDSVSPLGMMSHPLVMSLALACLGTAALTAAASGPWRGFAIAAATLLGALACERLAAGVRAAWRFSDPAALLFPAVHLLRDLAWAAAIGAWTVRRAAGRGASPAHSMQPRPAHAPDADPRKRGAGGDGRLTRTLCVLPAHNEAMNLAWVIGELRRCRPDLDVLVVDDGSTDETPRVLEELGVHWLRLPERLGIGTAMRTGLKYARRSGYQVVVRMDSDGQHRPEDIERLLGAFHESAADAVLGSRFADPSDDRAGAVRIAQRLLGACLGRMTGRRITDPTSGFYVLGPRAVRLLAEHHPTGYPEPELRLFLSRNALEAVEVPVGSRPRLAGRTSLTPGRMTIAGARVLLAMLIEPLRQRVD